MGLDGTDLRLAGLHMLRFQHSETGSRLIYKRRTLYMAVGPSGRYHALPGAWTLDGARAYATERGYRQTGGGKVAPIAGFRVALTKPKPAKPPQRYTTIPDLEDDPGREARIWAYRQRARQRRPLFVGTAADAEAEGETLMLLAKEGHR